MSNKREALEAALNALESERIMAADDQGNYTVEVTSKRILDAIEKVKAALAEPEQSHCKYGNTIAQCTSSPMDCQCAIDAVAEPEQEPTSHGEADFEQVMQERDSYHQTADELAQVIADITGEDIGEHSSANCPWINALSAGVNFQMLQKTADTSPREWRELSEEDAIKAFRFALDEELWFSGFAPDGYDTSDAACMVAYHLLSAALRAKNGG